MQPLGHRNDCQSFSLQPYRSTYMGLHGTGCLCMPMCAEACLYLPMHTYDHVCMSRSALRMCVVPAASSGICASGRVRHGPGLWEESCGPTWLLC